MVSVWQNLKRKNLIVTMYDLSFQWFLCLIEIEAKEACDWLRAAGFPQYAQLYEGNTIQLLYLTHRLHSLVIFFDFSYFLSYFLFLSHFSIICDSFSLPAFPQTLHPRLLCRCILFQGFGSSRGRGHGKGLVITAGTLIAPLSPSFLPRS